MTWFPGLAMLVGLILTALHISGTSSGAHWYNLGTGSDPRLLYGEPRTIRSDEWLVQQGWLVSQSHNGWAVINHIFSGGVDMSVLNELPSWDWSTLFRLHLWGYLLAGLDAGEAWEWWLPAIAIVAATYFFMITVVPRRPLTAALVAAGVFFTPLVQWWYGPSTMWPVAWAFLAMAGVVWVLRDDRRWTRWLVAGLVGYFAVTMAMGLYVPYIVPVVLVFVCFAVGYLLRVRPWNMGGFRAAIARIAPLLVSGGAAIAVVVVWAETRISVFNAISNTVYPGQRSEKTGSLLATDPHLLSFAGAAWDAVLKINSGATVLGANSSESSSGLLVALFLLPAVVWLAVRSFRRPGTPDALLLASLVAFAIVAVYLLVPGWDAVAHVLQLDRVPPDRFKIAFVVLGPLYVALLLEKSDEITTRTARRLALICCMVAAAAFGAELYAIDRYESGILTASRVWIVVIILVVAAVALLFSRHLVAVAAVFLLVASGLTGWNVNPVYHGVFNLSTTAVGRLVTRTNDAHPGGWVALGSYETMAVLVESGVHSYSGVQTYPSIAMWKQIDPTGRYRIQWDRLAHVQWVVGTGAPRVINPQPDVTQVTFDACSSFAQRNVRYVLSDQAGPASRCLKMVSSVLQGHLRMRIFEIVTDPRR